MSSKFQRINDTPTQDVSFPPAQTPIDSIDLKGATRTVSNIIDIPKRNLVAVASHDNIVRVYSLESSGAPNQVFRGHTDQVRSLALLADDVVVSVSDDRTVQTWHALSGMAIESAELENWALSVSRIDENRFVVGTTDGELVIFSHAKGKCLKQIRYLFKASTDWVFQISVDGNVAVSCSHNKVVAVWNTRKWRRLCLLHHDEWVKCVAVNENFIVAACYSGKLFVYSRNMSKFPLHSVLTTIPRIQSIQFIDCDTLVICGRSATVSILSVSDKHGIAQVKFEAPKSLLAMHVVHNGQIVVGGKDGIASLVSMPSEIELFLRNDDVIYSSNEEDDDKGSSILGSTVTCEQSELHESDVVTTNTNFDIERGTTDCMHEELNRMKSMRFNSRVVSSLNPTQCAAFLAAFLVKYDATRSENYLAIKQYLAASFEHNFVDGDVLIGLSCRGRKCQTKKLRGAMLAAVVEAEGVGKRLGVEYRLDLFLERLRNIEQRSQASGCIPIRERRWRW